MTKTSSPRAAFNAAVKEAHKVWPDAIVSHDPTAPTNDEKRKHKADTGKWHPRQYADRWSIGRLRNLMGLQFNEIMGSGDTWDEAMKRARTR